MRALRLGLDRGWRLLGTAISFAAFGLGGLLVGTVVVPLLHLLSSDPARRRRRVRRAVNLAMRAFVGLMQTLGVMRVDIHGAARLQRRGCIIVANHPSLIDAVLLLALLPQGNCIVKAPLLRNPFTRATVRGAGYVSNLEDAETLVADCTAALAAGDSLIVFPEGTRSGDGPLRLQRGAARIALAADAELLPVTIRCTPPTLRKHEPWYRIPPRAPQWVLDVGEPLPVSRFRAGNRPEPLAARALTAWLSAYFTEALATAPPSSEAVTAQVRYG